MTPTKLETPCLEYRGPRQSKGYGAPTFDGEQVLLHRWVIEQAEGRPLDPGEIVMHRCDNPPCFRLDHLRRATQTDNLLDAREKGRHRYIAHPGETNGQARLTEADVLSIREQHAAGAMLTTLAEQFSVCPSTIGNIVHRRKWKHL